MSLPEIAPGNIQEMLAGVEAALEGLLHRQLNETEFALTTCCAMMVGILKAQYRETES